MVAEVNATLPDWHVEGLGVNLLGQEASSGLVNAFSHLAWLHDNPAASLWSRWQVTYRDVFILGARNQLLGIYNLTQHDLGLPDNRAAFRQMLVQAARAVDADNDGLPDDWEGEKFGNLAEEAGGDADHDGGNNAAEFALGSAPNDPAALARVHLAAQADGSRVVSLMRPAGAMLDYVFESSTDLVHWSPVGAEFAPRGGLQIQFDGLGLARAEWRWTPAPEARSSFLRLRVVRREPR